MKTTKIDCQKAADKAWKKIPLPPKLGKDAKHWYYGIFLTSFQIGWNVAMKAKIKK